MRKWFIVGFIALVIFIGSAIVWTLKQKTVMSVVSPIGKILEKPLEKYAIENLSSRVFVPSDIVLDQPTATEAAFTVYRFHFISDEKIVRGVAHIPNDASVQSKKPVIFQFRGYVDEEQYFPGQGTQRSAEVFARNGFISLAPDFLGYGGSDDPSEDVFEQRFQTYTTALSLLASVSTLPMANGEKVGIWGHSNGGHIALTVLEILQKSIPTSLWAPVSKPFPYSILYYTDEAPDQGKFLRRELAEFEKHYDVDRYTLTNYLDRIVAPLQIHQGGADSAVPIVWTDAFVDTLEKEEKDVRYFTYPGADHNLSGAWNTVVGRDIEFFKRLLQ